MEGQDMEQAGKPKRGSHPRVTIVVGGWRRKPKRANASTPQVAPGLLTTDDLCERWKTSRERVMKRLRDYPMKSINLGSAKNPEWRFPLATVEAWERDVEGYPPVVRDDAPPASKPTVGRAGRSGKGKPPDNDPFARFR